MPEETPKPEVIHASPEQQAVADLSARITEVLDSQGVVANTVDDGSQVRKIEVTPHFGATLSEITAPDGTKHYKKTSFFHQATDRGLMTWQWQDGASSVNYTGEMEVAGTRTRTIDDEAGIQKVRSDIDYVASQLGEKQVQQKGLVKRFLGKLATRQ